MNKKEIFYLPNIISYIRIALMPVYVFVSLTASTTQDFKYSAYLLLFIASTDFLDGYTARKLNMVTDLGKFLDPLADKLFQLAISITLLNRIPKLWIVFIVFLVKEFTLAYLAFYYYLKHKMKMNGANIYGKTSSFIFYSMTFLMVLCPPLPTNVYYVMEALMVVALVVAFIQYLKFYFDLQKTISH